MSCSIHGNVWCTCARWGMETCKSCKEEWRNYRGGSYDWEYQDCPSCRAKKVIEIVEKMKEKKL